MKVNLKEIEKMVQNAIVEDEKRTMYESIVSSMPVGFAVLDKKGIIKEANKKFMDMVGISYLNGRGWFELTPDSGGFDSVISDGMRTIITDNYNAVLWPCGDNIVALLIKFDKLTVMNTK